MLSSNIFTTALLALAPAVSGKSVSATPHDKYSSSIGVLGCKIDTNRVAYWPGSVDCDNICVKVTRGSRSVHLLRIDQSGGAYDISYDAWVYLQSGKQAADSPITGGGIDVEVEEVDGSECADLILTEGSKLPLSASNSINFLTSCLEQPDSFIAKNHVLYNICDPICTLGYDEKCKLDLATSNQPSCPHTLGLQNELSSAPVYDIEYQSGNTLLAGSDEIVDAGDVKSPSVTEETTTVEETTEETEDTTEETEETEETTEETEETTEETEESTEETEETTETHEEPAIEDPVSSHTGGVFVESGSTSLAAAETTAAVEEVPVVEPTEAPEAPTEDPVEPEPTPISEPVVSVPEPTTLVTLTSTTTPAWEEEQSTSEVAVPTGSATTAPSVPSGTPSTTPLPENAGHSLADVPLSLLIASMLLCLMAI